MIFDILIIATIAYFTYMGFRKGLIGAILQSLAKLGAFVSAYIIATRYSSEFSKEIILPMLGPQIRNFIDDNVNLHDILQSLQKSIEPDNFMTEYLMEMSPSDISTLISLDTSSALTFLKEHITNTISLGVSYVLLFIIGYIVVAIAFKLIIIFLDFIMEITSISPLNRILGACLGFLGTFLLWYFAIWAVFTVLPLDLLEQTKESSTIVDFILKYEPNTFIKLIK